MKPASFLIALLLSAAAFTSVKAQTVHKLDHSTSELEELVAQAIDAADQRSAVIVFSFDKEMCEGCVSGIMNWNNDEMRSIEEVVLGKEPSAVSVKDMVQRTLDQLDGQNEGGLDDGSRSVLKEMAVLLHIENGSLVGARHANMSTRLQPSEQPVYWLGKHRPSDILELYDQRAWSQLIPDARKGWVWTVGALDLGNDARVWLEAAYGEEDDSEVRKAAAYALGEVDTDAAIQTLEGIVDTDPSMEVRKAAIYAIGNGTSDVAREALLTIIRTMGASPSS